MGKHIASPTRARRGFFLAGTAIVCSLAILAVNPAPAATYLPMPDSSLAVNAPAIVRALARESLPRLGAPLPGPEIVTVTDFDVLEVLKGKVPTGTIRLVLPGGRIEDRSFWVPGSPTFVPGQEVVLFLAPIPGRPGEYGPTEFALSVFDVLADPLGHRFAVRTMFQAGEEEVLDPDGLGSAESDHLREAEPFFEALRAVGRGEPMPIAPRRSPAGPLQMVAADSSGVRPLWVNIGGPEGSATQFRWFWGTGSGCASPAGVVNPVGAQSNLTEGTAGYSHLLNAAAQWSGIAGTDVRYSYSPTGGNVDVKLDVDSYSGAWSGPMDCDLGVVGLGGPMANCIGTYKGESFAACNQGTVSMRRSICSTGYPVAIFRSAVLHEIGHTLGLGHPDKQGTSVHSTTSPAEWNTAVMRSSLPSPPPDTPQSDDLAAIKYYYATAATLPPVANFSFNPVGPVAGQSVAFNDTSTNSPASWDWDFGDPASGSANSSTLRSPTHTFTNAGTYVVTLVATNELGSDDVTKQVTVSTSGPPVASFSFAPSSPSVGQSVQFTDTSSGGPTARSWDFGDGTFSSATNPTKAYAAAASYTVRLLVSNALGASSTTRTVPVTSSGSLESVRVVPVVLDAFGVGTSRFRSELVLANRGTSTASVELTYTASTALNATGSGTVTESLAPGRQWILDDVLAHLRSRGLAIPQAAVGASQGGSLRVRFRNLSSADAGAAVARTTALLPQGRAGVAYPAVAPVDWTPASAQRVFGLRESSQERSNLALVNLDPTADVGLRVTLNSGTAGDSRKYVLPETLWLRPLQWTQLGSILARAGFTNGWALVERVSGEGPFYSYGVFNDYGTNDGSFIDPVPVGATEPVRTIPVVLELGIYSTELILANPTTSTLKATLGYVESLAAAGVARRTVSVNLQPSEQRIVDAIPYLRSLGVDVGPAGGSYAGSLRASFQVGAILSNGFAGARTKSPGQPQGVYGVYYSGLAAGQAAAAEAWVFGLKQDGESRSNVAVVNAESSGSPVTLQAEVFDGVTGASRGGTGNVVLAPGQWFQWNELLKSFGLTQGYVRVFRVSGTSPFLAYGVVNDGGTSRPGTNDGSYVPMLGGR